MTEQEAEQATIIKILAGSHIHGIAVETSDRDEEAIVIEPLKEAFGLGKPFEELIRESPERDVKYVSLRKWCGLALKGNPNFLLTLFAPQESILKQDSRGGQLRDMKQAFLSRQAIKSHLGYLKGQRHRMLSGHSDPTIREQYSHKGRGKLRQDKIDQFGFDTKYAMHLIRLAWQGWELAATGKITLPIQEPMRSHLINVRHGLVPLDEVIKTADELEADMKREFDGPNCSLPEEPDYDTVNEKMLLLYMRRWSADRSIEDAREDEVLRARVCGGRL
jgi:uncharacterized protein